MSCITNAKCPECPGEMEAEHSLLVASEAWSKLPAIYRCTSCGLVLQVIRPEWEPGQPYREGQRYTPAVVKFPTVEVRP